MRLLSRRTVDALLPECRVGGSHFGPELTLRCLRRGIKMVEVPLNYKRRVGRSSVTGSRVEAFRLGLRMIAAITRFRLLPPK
jgi:hypothetical protein